MGFKKYFKRPIITLYSERFKFKLLYFQQEPVEGGIEDADQLQSAAIPLSLTRLNLNYYAVVLNLLKMGFKKHIGLQKA